MASLSCRISPRTSTVIFFDRSPLATAMVTSAILRTWAVRFDAIELTLSVRSFHTPVTPPTCAWPPSLPSVPTSRATRVTSEVNTLSCLIMVLTISAERRNSPLSGRPSTSRLTVRNRSPCATAAMARVTSVVGQSKSSISELTEDSISPQAPSESPMRTRCRVRPSRPTTWPTRSSCPAMRWLVPTISLNVSAILPMMPTRSPAMRTEKSPTRIACKAWRSSARPWASPSSACSTETAAAGGDEPLAVGESTTSSGACMGISEPRFGGRAREAAKTTERNFGAGLVGAGKAFAPPRLNEVPVAATAPAARHYAGSERFPPQRAFKPTRNPPHHRAPPSVP